MLLISFAVYCHGLRCSGSLFPLSYALWTAITWPVPFACYVALLLARKEAGSMRPALRNKLIFGRSSAMSPLGK